MKLLKQHWSTQPLSLLLSLLMALPIFALFLFPAPSVRAQGLASRQPTWAILDFANPSGYGGADVGRLAADSFVVELAKINRYNILPRQDLLNGIQAEDLTPPLNLTSIQRLGASLGVDAIVAGEIASISFSRDRRQAKVNLAVRVFEPRSGILINGALSEGYSNPRPIPVNDEEQLINEAFSNAAFNAVRKISSFNLPVATVLLSGDSGLNGGSQTVTLNKGTRDGIYSGLDMFTSREGLVTGRVRISDTINNESNAVITDLGSGIKPGDRATAIFHMPDYSIDTKTGTFGKVNNADVALDKPNSGTPHSVFSGIGGVLIALLAGALLVAAVRAGHKGSDNSLGGAGINGPLAIAGRSADLGGPLTTIPVGSTVSIANYIPVAVRITSNIGNISPTNFLEFHIYRSDTPAILTSPGSLGITPTITTSTNSGTTATNNTGGTLGISGFGQLPLLTQAGNTPLRVFDDLQNKVAIVASKPDPTDSSTLVTLTVATTTTTTVNGVTTNAGLTGTGLQFGQRVFYTVEGLYIQPATFSSGILNPGTNNNNGGLTTTTNNNTTGNNTTNTTGTTGTVTGHGETFQLTGRRSTNSVTYIEPVQPSANAVTGTGFNNINVTVPATRGANDYVLEVSTDAGFSNKKRYAAVPGSYASSATANNPTLGAAVAFNNINLTADFPNGTSFIYRIGARDPSNGSSETTNPYIYSDPVTLTLQVGTAAVRSRGRGR